MNPIRWLLKKSEDLANRRAGTRGEGSVVPSASLNLRAEEPRPIHIDGATLWITDPMRTPQWSALSADRNKYARIVRISDEAYRLSAFQRNADEWKTWEGPSLFASQAEATTSAEALLGGPGIVLREQEAVPPR